MKNRLLICLFVFLSLKVYSQSCTLSVSLTSSYYTICSGNSVTLTATASQGTAPYTYIWSTGETTSSISINKAGTYTVTVSDNTPGCAPVKKSISVNATPTPNPPSASSVVVCPNTPATLTATAPGGTYQWYDAVTGGNFLATGPSYTTQPITANTVYYVQTTVDSCTSARTPVYVSLPARPTVRGDTVCQGNMATLIASGGTSYDWYDASSGGNMVGTDSLYITPSLTSTKTYYVVVINGNGCSSARTPVTATVTAAPSVPTASNVTICSGTSAQLHASATTGIVNWYSSPNGGTPLISSPDYTTPVLTATTTYYVQTSLNGCTSAPVPVTVTVDTPPTPPAAQTDSICYNTSTTLTASTTPSGTYQWYDAPVNGNLLATGNNYITPSLTNSTAYFVQAVNGSCTTTRTQVTVIVRPQLSAPTTSGAIICNGSTATLTTKNRGGIYQWYSAATGGTLLATDTTYTTPALTANTTYYVQRTFEGCISPRAAVTVTVEGSVPAPTASNTTICAGNSATLTATSSNNIYKWYDAPSGGNLLSTAQVYATPVLTSTTTYYVQTTSSTGCNSPMTPVTVTVNPTPMQPTANGATVCPGTSAALTASSTSGTIQWYDSGTGGFLLATGNTYNTPPINTPTTYYVQSTNGTCTSGRTAVTVSLVPGTNPEFQYSSGSYCTSGPNTTPVINNPSGGTFSSTPGLVFVSTTTGEINVGASTPGTYTVSFTNNAPCPGTTSEAISIVTNFNSTFAYNGPFCQDGANPSPSFSGGSTSGTFSASPSGLVFVNTSTGEIDLTKSTPGTYTITNMILTSGSCGATSSSTKVIIYPEVVISAGPDQTLPLGSTVQLAGSISGGTTTGKWTGGIGSFSDPTDPTATYTPGPGETSATLTLTSSDPAGPCGPKSSSVTITFRSQPKAPTAAGTTICSGNNAYLSATAPGGTYRWYDAAAGGNLLFTGPTFTTPALTVDTTYYVETTVNGVTSNRTAVTVTITSPTATPTITGNTEICQGTSTTLTASGSAGTYQWYDSPTGGNLLSMGNTYTTPVLNYNASYYVEAKVNSCKSARTEVDIIVTDMPNVISAATGVICSGNPLNYTITADQPQATFSWSRAKVTGISNPTVNNQTTPTINDTLINTTTNPIKVTYNITPMIGSCSGPVFDYVVTVYPTPIVTSADSTTICNQTTTDYTVTFNAPCTTFNWSRPAVAGISNTAVSGQSAATIKEVLFNTTNAPVKVIYTFNYQTAACNGTPFNYVVTVNPMILVTSSATGSACSGDPQNYIITSNIPSATYSWSRAAVTNISNPAVTGQTSPTITEKLVNTSTNPVTVTYLITPSAFGCSGTPFQYVVNVNPSVATPTANSNSPVCVGTAIMLSTPEVIGATYQWTDPNGNIITGRTPQVNNAQLSNSGTYTLIETVRGCQSTPVTVNVTVDAPAVANTNTPKIVVCRFNDPSIKLNGTVTGGSTTGIWTSNGTGTFSPASNVLNATYVFSAADKLLDSVVLTLTSTSTDNCPPSVSTEDVVFGAIPGVSAGPDQAVCSQETSVPLSGKLFATQGTVKWTGGSGNFSPSPDQLNTNYIPDAEDISSGSVKLYLNLVGSTQCYFTQDSTTIKFIPPAKVNAGGTRYVLKGYTIQLDPIVNDDSLHYVWSPDIDINNDTLKNPTITGDIDRTYTVTVTDKRGCISSDAVNIVVSPAIKIDNTFTPNGDGINDTWNITGLIAYVNATVDIFTRYGQQVFHSVGYPIAWDGTYNGKALPVGVYYYVIHLNLNNQVLSGPVTILR